jgi:hypothetical protein
LITQSSQFVIVNSQDTYVTDPEKATQKITQSLINPTLPSSPNSSQLQVQTSESNPIEKEISTSQPNQTPPPASITPQPQQPLTPTPQVQTRTQNTNPTNSSPNIPTGSNPTPIAINPISNNSKTITTTAGDGAMVNETIDLVTNPITQSGITSRTGGGGDIAATEATAVPKPTSSCFPCPDETQEETTLPIGAIRTGGRCCR